MQVKVNIRGVEKIQKFTKAMPRGTIKVALAAIVEWIIGTPQRGLKHYQRYKHIRRKKAYGKTFVSDAQRGYVMAMIRAGRIDPGVPHRTGNTQRAYKSRELKGGYERAIEAKGAGPYYTRSDKGQARLNALAGWKKTSIVIQNNMAGALRHARAAVKAFLKKR